MKSKNSLSIDSITKLQEIKYYCDDSKVNLSNQLEPVLQLNGVNFPFTINDPSKLIALKYNNDNLKINSSK